MTKHRELRLQKCNKGEVVIMLRTLHYQSSEVQCPKKMHACIILGNTYIHTGMACSYIIYLEVFSLVQDFKKSRTFLYVV